MSLAAKAYSTIDTVLKIGSTSSNLTKLCKIKSYPDLGASPDNLVKTCDAAVFPSRWQEPFGLSGAEALAHGVPVVAFDVGGVREWLTDSVSGFIVPEKDTAAMAGKLDLLYRDKSLAGRLGKAALELVRDRFSPEKYIAAMKQLLSSVSR